MGNFHCIAVTYRDMNNEMVIEEEKGFGVPVSNFKRSCWFFLFDASAE